MDNIREQMSDARETIAEHGAQIEDLGRRTDELAEASNQIVSVVLDLQRRLAKFEGGVVIASILYALLIAIGSGAVGILIYHIINDK